MGAKGAGRQGRQVLRGAPARAQQRRPHTKAPAHTRLPPTHCRRRQLPRVLLQHHRERALPRRPADRAGHPQQRGAARRPRALPPACCCRSLAARFARARPLRAAQGSAHTQLPALAPPHAVHRAALRRPHPARQPQRLLRGRRAREHLCQRRVRRPVLQDQGAAAHGTLPPACCCRTLAARLARARPLRAARGCTHMHPPSHPPLPPRTGLPARGPVQVRPRGLRVLPHHALGPRRDDLALDRRVRRAAGGRARAVRSRLRGAPAGSAARGAGRTCAQPPCPAPRPHRYNAFAHLPDELAYANHTLYTYIHDIGGNDMVDGALPVGGAACRTGARPGACLPPLPGAEPPPPAPRPPPPTPPPPTARPVQGGGHL